MKHSCSKLFLCSLSLLLVCVVPGAVRGDVIRLNGGGEVRGVFQDKTGDAGVVTVQTATGLRVSIANDEVDFAERRSPLIEDYITRSRSLGASVDEHWELAEWCRLQGLADQRKDQLEQILDLDPDHPEARKILGYVQHLGRWMTKEDEMAERGYLRYNGRWVTRQELELKQANADQRESELAWIPKVRLWMGWITGNDPQRASAGLSQLKQIQDPDAIHALTKLLSQHPHEDVRLLFVSILGQMEGSRPVPSLVERLLVDGSRFVRRDALQALGEARYPMAVPQLIAALRNKSNSIVCHAAEALGIIGDDRAVPALIDALVTSHVVSIQVPAGNGVTFSNGGGLGPFSGTLPPQVEIAARTGQLPYGVNVTGPSVPQQMKVVNMTQEFKNVPVLDALEKMTGKNLGFNERDWHYWWAVQKG